MTITEFCKGRNVDAQAVRKYIIRHPEEFAGKTGKKGREITLLPAALEILEPKYPLIKLIEPIVGVDPKEHAAVCQELAIAERKLAEWENKKAELQIECNNLKAQMFLLEEKKDLEIQEKEMANTVLQERLNAERAEHKAIQNDQNTKIGSLKSELEAKDEIIAEYKRRAEEEAKKSKFQKFVELFK